MTVTRKARLQLWPEGASQPLSLHNEEREAIEKAQAYGPGTHTVRINGEVYLEVVVPGVEFKRVSVGGKPHIRVSGIVVTVNGIEQPVVFAVTEGDEIAVIVNGVQLGQIKA